METQSKDINEIVPALVEAQKKMKGAKLDGNNPHFKSKYASYESLRTASEDALSEAGLALTHQMVITGDKRVMMTQLSHASGQWMRSYLLLPQDKETPQGVGSGITYAKRYTLSSLLALSIDDGTDDDGEKAEAPYRGLEELRIRISQLLGEEVDIKKLELFVIHLVDTKQVSQARIIEQAMDGRQIARFLNSFREWEKA
jgi:hypothetical protein